MVNKNIVLEGARFYTRNFSGKPNQYNEAGDRNFCVVLEEDKARELKEEGWNVKKRVYDDGEEVFYLPVGVRFDFFPPKIVMINSHSRVNIDESTIKELDEVEIENIDMIIRPYNYEAMGRTGVKAYLKTMFVTIVEDELEKKYSEWEKEP